MDSINPLWLVLAGGIVAGIPIIIGLFTCYLKVSFVLGILRSAFGTQQTPSAVMVMTLSMALTCLVMMPVFRQSANEWSKIGFEKFTSAPRLDELEQLKNLWHPWREFLLRHCGSREIESMRRVASRAARTARSENEVIDAAEDPAEVILPAFILSELREAFAMGFLLLLPFIVIDLIIANLLAGLGMYMVNPAMLALPIKLLLFLAADGWMLISEGLVASYGVVDVTP